MSDGRPARQPRGRDGSSPRATSWDRVATWYDGWVGESGSAYHRQVALPATLELLDVQPGEDVLDIGCGQGVLAPHVARAGARYTGIDASPRLVALARRRHGRHGRFLEADATRLPAAQALSAASFDGAVFLLSIQDMDPLGDVVASAAWALRAASRLVVFMTHPAFRVPRHSGWGWDEGRGLQFRRVDSYLTPMAVPMKALGGPAGGAPTRSFHRPLEAYVTALAEHGFAIDALRELPDLPPARRPGRAGRADARAAAEIPLFLALRAVR